MSPNAKVSSRDIPGRLREYETIYILRPDLDDEAVGAVNAKVRKIIEDNGGTLLKVENWGKRRMAYTVRKQTRGTYLFWSYLGASGLVEEVERNLKLTDPVIRFCTVKLAENVDPKTRASEFTEEAFAKANVAGAEQEPEPLTTFDPDEIEDENVPNLNPEALMAAHDESED